MDPDRARYSASRSRGRLHLALTLLVAMLGGVSGGLLWVPLGVVAPFWIVWALPLLFGAAFASGMAFLVAGPATSSLSRPLALSLAVAAACAAGNLVVGTVPGVGPLYDLLPPGGQKTLFAESLVVGTVAGLTVLGRGAERHRRWIPTCVALVLSAVAIAALLYVGSAIVQVEFGPEPSVPGDRA